jgi:chromosome segregation ATPase
MSETNKPKRPHSKSARARSRPPPRDPRVEDVEIPRDVVAEARPLEARPRADALTARIASLETELARLKEDREADADQVARMLVRIAAAERAKAEAEHRAELAEREAAKERADLEQAKAEMQSDRSRFTDLEAKLATASATLARATGLIEEIERREELTASMRVRSLEQARRVLAGESTLTALEGEPSQLPVLRRRSTLPQGVPKWDAEASTAGSNREAKAIEDTERDSKE